MNYKKYFLVSLFFLPTSLFGFRTDEIEEWDNAPGLNEVTFIQGTGLNVAPPIQGAPYTKEWVSMPNFKEEVSYAEGIDVVRNPHYVHFPEIEFDSPSHTPTNGIKSFFKNIFLTVFTWNNITTQCYRFFKKFNGTKSSLTIQLKAYAQQAPFSLHKYHIIMGNINYGQEQDIGAIKQTVEQLSPKKVVFYGISRAASAFFNFFATEKECLKKINEKIAVLEGPYSSIDQLLKDKHSTIMRLPGLLRGIHTGLEVFTSYQRNGPSPSALVQLYPSNLPTLIVTSKNDDMVPHINTLRIAKELFTRKECKDTVSLLCLERATHCRYPKEAGDKEHYQAGVHAFYKKHKFPYHSTWANEGEKHLLQGDEALNYIRQFLPDDNQQA